MPTAPNNGNPEDDDKTPTKKKMPENPSEEQIIMMLSTLDEELCTMHPTLKEKNMKKPLKPQDEKQDDKNNSFDDPHLSE